MTAPTGARPDEGGDEPSGAWIRAVLSLSDVDLRLAWLAERLSTTPLESLATTLEALAARAYAGDVRAREALLPTALTLARKRSDDVLPALREEAARAALLNLDRLVRGGPEDAPSSESEARVPTYRKGRELTLGERRSLARRPSRLDLEKLLLDPDPLVLRQVFACSRLTEDDVVRLASQRPARRLALVTLLESSRWTTRRRVRLSLVMNPGCPHGLAQPLLSTLPRDDLELVIASPALSAPLRATALELLELMPPWDSAEPITHQ